MSSTFYFTLYKISSEYLVFSEASKSHIKKPSEPFQIDFFLTEEKQVVCSGAH